MDFKIRLAEKSDMPEVLKLIKELAVFEKEPEAVIINESVLETYGFGENPMFTCFVADSTEGILGMALVFFRFSTWKGKALHLEDLIVNDAFRGKGIGSALYKRVMEYAVEQKVNRVQWEVLDWNTPAIEFYEKSGAKVLHDWNVVHIHKDGFEKIASE